MAALPKQYESRADVEYLLRALYFSDLMEAQGALTLLRRTRNAHTRISIIRDFIVTYSKPFSGNRAPLGPKHSLRAKDFVPRPWRVLHREVLEFRGRTIAHTDFEYHRPRVARWELSGGPVFPVARRTATYTTLITRRKELELLCEAVRERISAAQHAHERATGMRA